MSLSLHASRREVLEQIFEATDNPLQRTDLFLEQAAQSRWLNSNLEWESEGRRELLHEFLQRELNLFSHLGGEPTPAGEHEGIVGIRAVNDFGWESALQTVGSGVRVGERLVLTARHVAVGRPEDAYISGQPNAFGVKAVVMSDTTDVAVLVFEEMPASTEIVPLAESSDLTKDAIYRSIGYGFCPGCSSIGPIKNHLDGIVVLTMDCLGEGEADRFHCQRGKQLVAGSLRLVDGHEKAGMAYFGDSGGGLLVSTDEGWKLAGIVAGDDFDPNQMAARYTRVDAVRDELNAKLCKVGHPTF